MFKIIQQLAKKHKEMIVYVIFGVLTTAFDWLVYLLLKQFMDENIANALSQAAAIVFAFFTNKVYVFNDKSFEIKIFLKQFIEFSALRLVTLGINSGAFFCMTKLLNVDDIISKISVSVIVLILNFIFSKLIVFKNKGAKKQ